MEPERSLDIDDAGQVAPGRYYNRHGVTSSRRIDLDEHGATRPEETKEERPC
ncbi:hypothetical protein [Pyrinomonas sp.]|uniref:hypothetical protein n=1 Tax=Pyrinomonas sp. TaxID=2080306 RepID=UPI003333C90A